MKVGVDVPGSPSTILSHSPGLDPGTVGQSWDHEVCVSDDDKGHHYVPGPPGRPGSLRFNT